MRLACALAVVLLALAAPQPAHAAPEATLAEAYEAEILPWCLDHWREGSFAGAGGVKIAWAAFTVAGPRGALVIVPGRSEPMLQYCEVVHDLRDTGYDIYLVDHRGQGWSGRLAGQAAGAYLDDFDDLVDDFATFMHTVVRPHRYARVVALAHSMGGGVVTRYAQLQPDVFDSLVLSAPLHAINRRGIPEPIAYGLAVAATLAGRGADFAPWQSAADAEAPFASSDDTHSEARWRAVHGLLRDFPELAVGGSSFRWVKELLEGAAELRFWARTLRVPTLIFQASDDIYVDNRGQDEVCAAASSCTKVLLPGTFHSLLQERDEVRDVVLAAVRARLY
jgi:lysophospholipase